MDKWNTWLLHNRFGGNRQVQDATLNYLGQIRDEILKNSEIKPGEVLLDVGTGDGLLGFKALETVGQSGKVIFSDISQDVVDTCKQIANDLNINQPIEFLANAAEDLSGVADGSVDVVVCRAALLYSNDKPKCFNEFFRVLKSGGRLSISEPINRFAIRQQSTLNFMGFDLEPLGEIGVKFLSEYNHPLDLENDPMINFDERDLFSYAVNSGFGRVGIEYTATVNPNLVFGSWEKLSSTSPNPLAPTINQAIGNSLDAQEAEKFISFLKPKVENEAVKKYNSLCYLVANKP